MIRTNNTLFLLDGIDYAELCLKCCYGMAVLLSMEDCETCAACASGHMCGMILSHTDT